MTPVQIEELSTALVRCCRHGSVSPLRLDRIASAEDAPAVQAAVVEAYDRAPRSYTIQAVTALSQRLLRCNEPFFGPSPDSGLAPSGSALRLNGNLIASGSLRDALGHRLEVMAWLICLLMARDHELDVDDTVSTGTSTGLLQSLSEQTFEAEVGGFGSVRVSFG